MRLERYKSYIRLISIIALVLHFIKNLRRKINKNTLKNLNLSLHLVGESKLSICERLDVKGHSKIRHLIIL